VRILTLLRILNSYVLTSGFSKFVSTSSVA